MQNFVVKPLEDIDLVEIKCPQCNSDQIVLQTDPKGYYRVIECNRCGFKDNETT